MSNSTSPITIVSAPGKVLLAGGYLVLDQTYTGLVVATSSRFYCIVRSSSTTDPSTKPGAQIIVRAGQFPAEASTWTYNVASTEHGIGVEGSGDGGKNKFVEIALSNAMRVVVESRAASKGMDVVEAGRDVVESIAAQGVLEVVVLADNDFYSQREQLAARSLPPLLSSLDALEPFTPLSQPIHRTNKTGLGSSAGLVTSLTAGILAHFGVVDIPTARQSSNLHHTTSASEPTVASSSSTSNLDLVHNLAQFSHCLAQGKVGSGFDVSSAVYGTHTYRRFSPSILAPLMSSTSGSDLPLLPEMQRSKWDHSTTPFALPKGLRLMLADVDAGTDTPSFVGKVLKWREANKDAADELWGHLGKANESLGQLLRDLAAKEGQEGYDQALEQASSDRTEQIEIGQPETELLARISAALTLIRSYLQQMSALSGVPIEPPEQTRLIDTCSSLPGVLGGGVPGAGGYDALFLLVIDRPDVVSAVESVWSAWTEMSVCPLSARQSDGGLQRESLDGVKGLAERLG